MKKLFKSLIPLIIFACSGMIFAATTGFDDMNTSGRYYGSIVSGSLLNGDGVQNLLFNIFFVLAGFLFTVALIVAFIAAIRLLISDNSEEDFSKWGQTLVWSIFGLLLVALSYGFVKTLYSSFLNEGDTQLSINTIYRATIDIIYPILNFLRYIAAICFFCVIVYAFYRIMFSLGDEEGFQNGKRIFIISTFGFIIMLLAEPIVRMAYGGGDCSGKTLFGIPNECTNRVFDTGTFFDTVVKIIIFLNGFIALVTLIMIIYAGFLVLTGGGDEEKSEKARKTITYAIIGVLIIIFSYVIYRVLLFNVS